MRQLSETDECHNNSIPALKTLMVLGWSFISSADCLTKRGNTRELILKDELIEYLKQQRFEYRGESHPLSANSIETIVRELCSPGLNEGLLPANEKFYNTLLLGKTVIEFIDGKKYAPTIPIIDWENIDNNRFHVTEAFEVLKADETTHRYPDIVCFVNGLPLVVIEAKQLTSPNVNKDNVAEAIRQQIRNQKPDEIPCLFIYAQLLFAISTNEGCYGTTKTPQKFWTHWQEESGNDGSFDENYFQNIKDTSLTQQQTEVLFSDKNPKLQHDFEELWKSKPAVNGQDRLLISLLSLNRFLHFIRFNILFDDRVGKIAARYPQASSAQALIKKINHIRTDGGRDGGVIWHTTGSGKSFTMVFLCKALLLHPTLKDCRIIVVTDRIQLEKQLANTFAAAGVFGSEVSRKKAEHRIKAKSGRDLARRIGQGDERIIFSLIQKFNDASKHAECYNASQNIIVLVDEGHRSQYGENHQRMRKALPKAAFIAFTGTPLLKDDKTMNKFGRIIHAYTMQDAEKDGMVTPLLYEERQPKLFINSKAIDKWFDRITASLSRKQSDDLKKKFSTKHAIYNAENRIELIAWDIASHFHDNIKNTSPGLKGQLATASKVAAITYQQCLDATGLVTSAVVISPPDMWEGYDDIDEKQLPLVQEWWKNNVGNDDEQYEKDVLYDFSNEGDPDILIVVDKLLIGFDEPRNAVLYIDKPLKEHNLIQAIARVNRLHEKKDYGFLIDYRGILEELDTSIKHYQDLADRTQAGYDINDIDGLYHQISTEYKKLPKLHDALWSIFSSVEDVSKREQFRRVLLPDYTEDDDGNTYDKKQKIREDFYKILTDFGLCLKIALSSQGFHEDSEFSENRITRYKHDLSFFTELRVIAKRDAQETIDYSEYEQQISRLVATQVVGNEIRESAGVYLVNQSEQETPEAWSHEKTRNETDIIRTRITRTIEQDLADDPFAQTYFSELLQDAIDQTEARFEHSVEQYTAFKQLKNDLENRTIRAMPSSLKSRPQAQIYYGVLAQKLGYSDLKKIPEAESTKLCEQALFIEETINKAVAEFSLGPKNIEAAIRNGLLPVLFKAHGMDVAKDMIEELIYTTRIRISRKYKND